MTTTEKALAALLGAVVLVGLAVMMTKGSMRTPSLPASPPPSEAAPTQPKGPPTFAWSYRAFEEAEIPRTAISLTAAWPDGTLRTQLIDTIEGGCDEQADPGDDVYAGSTEILCYYAGLGRYYKVVEADGAYEVRRKEFEEASPEYDPPLQDFVTIATF